MQCGPLHYRQLEKEKSKLLKQNGDNFDAMVEVTDTMRKELQWWIENLSQSGNAIDKGAVEIEIETDATPQAWGAYCQDQRTGGFFSYEERLCGGNNINAFELFAVQLALQAFEENCAGKNVLIRSDNTTTVAYIANMGGIRSELCNDIVHKIWTWCLDRNIWLSAEHLAGRLNFIADFESGNVNEGLEWGLCPSVFALICQKFGWPEIDMFASRLNKKLPRFVSWRPDPEAEQVNAFSCSWANMFIYCFPPFSLIARCLKKIFVEKVDTVIMVVPLWPTQVWFAQLMTMLIEIPVVLPRSKRLLQMPQEPEKIHPLYPKMRLIACKLSGNHMKILEFQQGPLTLLPALGDLELKDNMALTYKNGLTLCLKGRLITINHL
jgi:hypothetical protein